ncbi:flippase-like domain-containing protein [Streptosporangiaceae bacterium NEAU-GS5]|nr:flippase-like domain-containing protein [Streptosporangiaceae bacterium NEAU-GS5]
MLSRVRSSRLLRVVLALVALGFLTYSLARNWSDTRAMLGQLSWWALGASLTAVLVGYLLMLTAWWIILSGLGSRLPFGVAARVLYVGQLGKYIPGSVWAFAAMMELARDHGAPPRRTFSATALGLVTSLGCALALAVATLPQIVGQAWYLVALIPLIAVGLHPRVMTWGLNLALRIARREPLERVLSGADMLKAIATTLGGWLLYGLSAWILVAALQPGGLALYGVAAGSYALAWATGILTVVVPAGIGVREGAMVLALAPTLGVPRALAVAVVTRVTFTVADVLWAGFGVLLSRTAQPATRVSTYAAQ